MKTETGNAILQIAQTSRTTQTTVGSATRFARRQRRSASTLSVWHVTRRAAPLLSLGTKKHAHASAPLVGPNAATSVALAARSAATVRVRTLTTTRTTVAPAATFAQAGYASLAYARTPAATRRAHQAPHLAKVASRCPTRLAGPFSSASRSRAPGGKPSTPLRASAIRSALRG